MSFQALPGMSRQGCVISPSKRQICNSARQCFDFSASAPVHPAQAPLDRCVQLAASSQRWIAKVCCTAQHESDPSCSGRWAQQDTATAVAVLWGLEGEDPETVCQPREGDQDHDADRCRHEEQVQGDRPRGLAVNIVECCELRLTWHARHVQRQNPTQRGMLPPERPYATTVNPQAVPLPRKALLR